jgi:hypothetical protein
MDDVRRVHVVATFEDLVHEVLHVVIRQILSGVDNSVHVSLHQLCDYVNIFEASAGRWLCYIHKLNYIFMVEELE